MQLALERGCSLRQLLATTSADELAEYQALYTLSPFGLSQENWRFAVLCSVLHNIHAAKGQHRGPVEFLKLLCEVHEEPQDLALAARKITAQLGGMIRGNNQ